MEKKKKNDPESSKKLNLEEINLFFNFILDHTPILIALMDLKFNFIRVNRLYAEADDKEISFYPGKNHFYLYPNEENEKIFRRVVETGESFFIEAKLFEYVKHPERGISFWDWSLIRINDPKSNFNGLLLTLQNVTKRKLAEQRLEDSEAMYRKAYNLVNFYKNLFAHDMNNILQGIISSAEFYSMFRNDPETLEKLGDIAEVVKKHARRGSELISNIMKLSKLDETEEQLNAIEIFDILNQSVEHTVNGFQERNVKIDVDGLFKDMRVFGNELLIDVFDNILNNAVKYNDNKKQVKVEVNISRLKENRIQFIKLEFKDHGMGISNEKKAYLFERSYTNDISKRGMGLGLSLVKRIVDKYEGKIWIEDSIKEDYTKGSNFILLLKEAQ